MALSARGSLPLPPPLPQGSSYPPFLPLLTLGSRNPLRRLDLGQSQRRPTHARGGGVCGVLPFFLEEPLRATVSLSKDDLLFCAEYFSSKPRRTEARHGTVGMARDISCSQDLCSLNSASSDLGAEWLLPHFTKEERGLETGS